MRKDSFNQLAYNDLQLPGIQQKSANEPALRSLPTKRSVSGDSEQSQKNGERFVATKEPVMNMSNSAEKTTVGGRSASKVFGALSGKSRGESHWVSRSWENKQIFALKEVKI